MSNTAANRRTVSFLSPTLTLVKTSPRRCSCGGRLIQCKDFLPLVCGLSGGQRCADMSARTSSAAQKSADRSIAHRLPRKRPQRRMLRRWLQPTQRQQRSRRRRRAVTGAGGATRTWRRTPPCRRRRHLQRHLQSVSINRRKACAAPCVTKCSWRPTSRRGVLELRIHCGCLLTYVRLRFLLL